MVTVILRYFHVIKNFQKNVVVLNVTFSKFLNRLYCQISYSCINLNLIKLFTPHQRTRKMMRRSDSQLLLMVFLDIGSTQLLVNVELLHKLEEDRIGSAVGLDLPGKQHVAERCFDARHQQCKLSVVQWPPHLPSYNS